jgi:hypothetical protein
VRNGGYEGEGQPLDEDLRVVLGLIADSPDELRRVRLIDAAGEERARLSGVLTYEDCDGFSRLSADGGGGLSASLTIPVDPDTRCTISPDGTMACTLPNGATWITTPLDTTKAGRGSGRRRPASS